MTQAHKELIRGYSYCKGDISSWPSFVDQLGQTGRCLKYINRMTDSCLFSGFLRVCTYCHKVVQRHTQSSDLNVVRNLEQLQAVLPTINSESDLSTTNPSNMTMTVPKPYPFDFDDEEHIYIQPLLRKASGTGASGAAGISYYEKFDQKERPSPMSGRRPFDAFGVCAAEADMLKQVKGSPKGGGTVIYNV